MRHIAKHLSLVKVTCTSSNGSPAHFAGVLRLRNCLGLPATGVSVAGVLAAGVLGGLPGPCTWNQSPIQQL